MLMGIISGLISGFISSLLVYVMMWGIRPKFVISNKICRKKLNDGRTVHMVKVANLSRAFLTDIEYSLEYCTVGDDDRNRRQVIEPIETTPVICIDKYSEDNTDYAIRFVYEIDEKKYDIKNQNYFLFTFCAHHSFSNAMKIKRVIYRNDAIQDGVFETGKSIKILSS